MSSVFAMVAVRDLPMFDKGDVITLIQDGQDFGAKIKNNSKFRIMEITGAVLGDLETIMQPLVRNRGVEGLEEKFKQREFNVDVDNHRAVKFSKTAFMNSMLRKTAPVDEMLEDVVV